MYCNPNANSTACADHSYEASVSNSPVQIFTNRGNLYGFLVENNTVADCFIQLFDAATIGAVTVGTTAPNFTFKVPASGAMGKDATEIPIHFFAKGCVVAVTTTRTGSTAPASGATCQFWHYNSKY